MGGSGPAAKKKCEAYAEYGCLWLGGDDDPP